MYCPQCGAENADNRTLCVRCRKPLALNLVVAQLAWRAVLRTRRS
jgi:predicted amidophosphoribosyltransferase